MASSTSAATSTPNSAATTAASAAMPASTSAAAAADKPSVKMLNPMPTPSAKPAAVSSASSLWWQDSMVEAIRSQAAVSAAQPLMALPIAPEPLPPQTWAQKPTNAATDGASL